MKKTYQNPELQIVAIQTTQMMAASPLYGGSTTETSGNLSRKIDFDDEEDIFFDE